MELKDLLEELKVTTIETDGDVLLILKKEENQVDIRYFEDTCDYEVFSIDILFAQTALGKYVYLEEDEDAEEDEEEFFEILGSVPEEDLLKHLPSIFAFEDYEISAEY